MTFLTVALFLSLGSPLISCSVTVLELVRMCSSTCLPERVTGLGLMRTRSSGPFRSAVVDSLGKSWRMPSSAVAGFTPETESTAAVLVFRSTVMRGRGCFLSPGGGGRPVLMEHRGVEGGDFNVPERE
jgi:hypothetical protein